MLSLSGHLLEKRNFTADAANMVMRVSEDTERPRALRQREAFLLSSEAIPDGFGTYLVLRRHLRQAEKLAPGARLIVLPDEFSYLANGDVIRISPKANQVRALYRRQSPHNNFLVTERCNHYCLMCSQPPKDIDDSWIVQEILDAIPLIDPATAELGFTGGEPTLLGEQFLAILRTAKSYLPRTAVHVLSNGRLFADSEFARRYAEIDHPDIMIGIPIYSDISTIHDYVVQADGAFDETLRGIMNLKQYGQRVEIRVVVHCQTYQRLPQLAEFLVRNLTFVDQVALMGLEITGFTRANLGALWIDPFDYQRELYQAVSYLADSRMNVSIYNHQLCVLDRRLWPFARKSISDWKNEYLPACANCAERENCGGLFASAKLRHSDHIAAIADRHPG